MATIQRGIKSFGTRTFAGERAAAPGNKAPILSVEVDKDFDILYSAWNGPPNIPPLSIGLGQLAGNSVDSSKIVDGSITLADLHADSVDASKIVDGSVGTLELAANAVTTVKILDGNVTREKLAIGASLWKAGYAKQPYADPGTPISSGQTIASYLAINSINTRVAGLGQSIAVMRVYIHGQFSAPATDASVSIRIKRDGAQFDSDTRQGQGNNAIFDLYYESLLTPSDTAPHNYTVDVFSQLGFVVLKGGTMTILVYS